MGWPTSQDYNEAIQNPATSFADPDLKKGEVALNSIGLPVPRSGNFADVYEFKTPDGKKWALKLFTRKVAGLQERYAKIDEHLSKAKFPFTVGFKYMAQGIRIRGEWYPLLKMEWVEGFTLNEFVRDNAGKPQYLHALMQMWGKLTALLRDADFAHADLQHGNVLLVPATSGRNLGLRLIDYDGMWVPSLAETHSGEVGHPNFQHPLRLKDRLYNADVDRFPHLVIAAALRGTLIGGKPFWDQFDNSDNLLFKETDLRDPANSPVFKAMWNLNDSVLCTLVGKMALATKEPLRKTPWLDDLLLTDEGKRLQEHEEAKVMQMLGVGPHFTAAATADAPAVQEEFNAFAFEDEEPQPAAKKDKSASQKALAAKDDKKPKKKGAAKEEKKSKLPLFIGGGVAAVLALVGIIIAMSGGGGGGKKNDSPSQQEQAKVEPKRENPKIVVPPEKKKDKEEPKEITKKDEQPPKKDPDEFAKKNEPKMAAGKFDDLDLLHADASTIPDGYVRLSPIKSIVATKPMSGNVEINVVARTDGKNIRLDAFKGACVIFNWELNDKELRVCRPNGQDRPESGQIVTAAVEALTPNEWHTLRWIITDKGMSVHADGKLIFEEKHDYDLSAERPIRVRSAHGSTVDVQSIVVKPYRPEEAVAVGAPALLNSPFTKEQAEKARADWAKFLNIPERKELDLGKDVKLEVVLIPPGEFMMGPNDQQRGVTISKPFYLAANETTQEQFETVMGNNPSGHPKGPKGKGPVTSRLPVESVTWHEAVEFSAKVNAKLPTEAQWEYACRGGTTTLYSFGNEPDPKLLNAENKGGRPVAVRSYPANAFGLFDMHGNVLEWCRDYGHYDFGPLPQVDPEQTEPQRGEERIQRGGSYYTNIHGAQSSSRSSVDPNKRAGSRGFRVMLPAPINPAVVAKLPDPEPKDIGKKEPPAQLGEFKSLWTVKHQVAHGTLVFTENHSSVTLRDARTGTIVTHAVADGKRTHSVKIPSPDAISFAIVLPNGLFFGRDNRSTGIAWDLAKDVEAFRITGVPDLAALYPWTDKSSSTFMLPHNRGEIDIYSVKDGAKTGSIQLPPKSAVGTAAITPDGKTIAVMGQTGEVGIRGFDQKWRQIGQLEAGKGKLRLAISPDAKHVAFNQAAGPVHVLDTATGKKKLVLSGHEGEVFRFSFTTSGRHLLTVSMDRTLRMWDVQTGKEVQKVALSGEGRGLAISSDGRFAVTTTSDETVQLWELPTAAVVKLPEPKPPVVKKNPAPMIPKNATFDAKDAGVVVKSEALSEFLRGALFSGDGKKIFATSMAGTLHVLDAATLKEESKHTLSEDKLSEPAISYKTATTPERLYVIDAKRKLFLFETEKKLNKEIALDGRSIDGLYYHLRASPDAGMLFATELNGGPQIIWDLQENRNGIPAYIPKPVVDRLMSVAYSPDGQVGCASNAKQIAVWNAQTGEAIRTFDAPNFPKHVACCPEASAVFYYTNRDGLFAVDYQTGMPLWSITSEDRRAPIHFIGAVPNLPAIVVVREDRSVTMLDARDGKEIVKWTTANWPVVGLSPDGKHAAIGYGKIKQVFLYKLPVLGGAAP